MTEHRDRRDVDTEERARQSRIAAAIATLTSAGLSVVETDDQWSLVDGRFDWHRLTNMWRERATEKRGTGLWELIKAAKTPAAKKDEGPVPPT